jgi:K+-transporting ATPase ATPase B chain
MKGRERETASPPSGVPAFGELKFGRRHAQTARLLDRALVRAATVRALKMLHPRTMARNPVMFVAEIGAALTTISAVAGRTDARFGVVFNLSVAAILWATVLFANFAEALAEARGKAQADSLKRTRQKTTARKAVGGSFVVVSSDELRADDLVVVRAGEIIPADGEVVKGAASVDESAITGESAPVLREAGGDRSGVTGGTKVLSDEITIQITAEPGRSFLDRMIALVEGAVRQKTPNETALSVVLAGFTLMFLLVTVSLRPMGAYFRAELSDALLVSLLVCLIPTTIGGLLAAIGIAGMDRALAANVLAKSGKAVELAGDIDTLLLDKTGTITIGNRKAMVFHPLPGIGADRIAAAAMMASFGDETPEGRSIISLSRETLGPKAPLLSGDAEIIAFSAATRLSGLNLPDGRKFRKGAPDAMAVFVENQGGRAPAELRTTVEAVAVNGGTPIVVAENASALGVVALTDVLKPGIRDRLSRLRMMGLRLVMVTGDNPLTAAAIAREAGVDDFIAEAKPEDKLAFIRREQGKGSLVAMMGDGTNDAPALAQADIGVAMNSGTQAAKEAGNMVDLDSDPTKLIEIIEIGKQLLITRGALTTFSIANDMAKYFAIVPAMFIWALPQLAALNVMRLGSPRTAILSALIFNAVIIPLLIPLALRGVRYRPLGAAALLRRNLSLYGLGGVLAPFAGIKAIDLVLVAFGLR